MGGPIVIITGSYAYGCIQSNEMFFNTLSSYRDCTYGDCVCSFSAPLCQEQNTGPCVCKGNPCRKEFCHQISGRCGDTEEVFRLQVQDRADLQGYIIECMGGCTDTIIEGFWNFDPPTSYCNGLPYRSSYTCTSLDPIGEWSVGRVQDMNRIFAHAGNFNLDISKWDVSSVTNMELSKLKPRLL